MIIYIHLIKFRFATSKHEVDNIFHVNLHIQNYWPHGQNDIKPSVL